MLEPLLLPALLFAARHALAEGSARVLSGRLAMARHAAVRAVNELLVSTAVNVGVNVALLLLAVYGLRGRLPPEQVVLAVASVYATSVLHAALKLVTNGYWIYELARYLLRHGWHGPRAWLRAHVAREVESHFRGMGALRRLAYRFSGAPPARDLVEILTRQIWGLVAARVAMLVAVVALYIALFALYTRPILIAEATRLNWVLAFLWPFGFAIDYFLHTGIAAWIERALRF
jgi:hypothetical protein